MDYQQALPQSLIILILFLGLKTKKIYDTKDIIGKPISKLELKILNENNNFNTADLRKNNLKYVCFLSFFKKTELAREF